MRLRTAMVLWILTTWVCAQGADATYGTVTGDRVRVRGGPADFHVILGQMMRDAPVKILSEEGDWVRVAIPGGLPVFVGSGSAARPYLREPAPGEAVVIVNDLMIRGTASKDFPAIGRLRAGDRVIVLDKQDGWVRLLSPEGASTWIHGRYVERATNQATAAQAWQKKHEISRRGLLESGALSRQYLQREALEVARKQQVKDAFDKYEAERIKAWEQRDIASVRKALTALRDDLPGEHPDRNRAEVMLTTLDEWERAGKAVADVRKRFEDAAREAKEAETRYATSLETLRKEVATTTTEKPKADVKGPYVAKGYVQRRFPVSGVAPGPSWTLMQGQHVLFLLESDRYDFGEFEGKLLGILEAGKPETRSGLSERVLPVRRVEILDKRPAR